VNEALRMELQELLAAVHSALIDTELQIEEREELAALVTKFWQKHIGEAK
jgi:hypothetical protein